MTAAMKPGNPVRTSRICAGKRTALVPFLLYLSISFVPWARAEPAPLPAPGESTARTLSRTADFIVLQGSDLPAHLGKRIDSLSLLSRVDGKVAPIPFQVDELDADGEWVLPNIPSDDGETASRVIEGDETPGILDENDQLVFMVRDSGDRIPGNDLPGEARTAEEISLEDPVDHGRSWVYLCSFPSAPPVSEADYVSYRHPGNRVVTSNYELGFSKKVPISWDHLSFRGSPNMIDRMKMRFDMKILGIRYRRDETHFKTQLSSYKDGPVRVIRRVRSSIKVNRLLRTPSAASESIYYDNAIVIPYRAKVPVSLKSLKGIISDMNSRGGADMQNLHGWKLRPETDDRWLSIDGSMDAAEESVRGDGATWFVLAGPPGAFLCRIILDRKWDGSPQELPITTTFYYMDDDKAPDPPEFVPGQSPNAGFLMDGMEKLEKGMFYFYIIGYMITDYRDGMETQFLDIMDRPLEIFVQDVPLEHRPGKSAAPNPSNSIPASGSGSPSTPGV